jgi:hypothetical protein
MWANELSMFYSTPVVLSTWYPNVCHTTSLFLPLYIGQLAIYIKCVRKCAITTSGNHPVVVRSRSGPQRRVPRDCDASPIRKSAPATRQVFNGRFEAAETPTIVIRQLDATTPRRRNDAATPQRRRNDAATQQRRRNAATTPRRRNAATTPRRRSDACDPSS